MKFRRPRLANVAPEQRRAARVTVRRWVLVLFAVLGVVGWGWGVLQSHDANTASQTSVAEASTTHTLAQELIRKDGQIQKILRTHTDEIAEVKQLAGQVEELLYVVASVDLKLPAADQYLGSLAANLLNNMTSVCNAVHASCATFVAPPASSSTSGTTTTTTVAPHPATTTTTTRPRRRGHR